MSYAENPYSSWGGFAAQAPADERTRFIRKTYIHLIGAVLGFVGIEAVLINSPLAEPIVNLMMGGRFSWLFVMLAFMGVAMLSERWARSTTSIGTQYLGLSLYVVAEAIIFLPILLIAQHQFGTDIISSAAMITLVIFGGLTVTVFLTGKDFSFLRTALMMGGFAALGLVACAVIFGFQMGPLFSGGMIVLASGYILYDTSNVMHHYRIGQHVAAALALFSSVALLFFYVLRLMMEMNRR